MTTRRIVAGVIVAGAVLLSGTAPASATTFSGTASSQGLRDCEVRVGSRRFDNGSHVKVPSNRPTTIAVTALEDRPRYKTQLELAGIRTTVGTGQGREFGWRRALNVPSYADYGVGTYRLHVVTTVDGEPCAVTGLIDITGRAPLTTVAGGVSTLAALLGILGLVVILFRRGGSSLRTRQGFGVDDPLGEFAAVATPGDYVGWAEVACDLGARTFVTAKPSADAVRSFIADPATHARLGEIASRGVRIRPRGDGAVLPRLSWRPRPFLVGPLVGILSALGAVVLLQQSAVLYLAAPTVAAAATGGLIAGLVIANLSRLSGAVGLNRRLAAAEVGLEEEVVEPRYPPIDHLDHLDTFVWSPTHTVPDDGDGLPAWAEPDKSQEHVATLDPGLAVRVVERRDGLAQIICSNGWVGWTDAEPLQELDA